MGEGAGGWHCHGASHATPREKITHKNLAALIEYDESLAVEDKNKGREEVSL